MDRAHSHDKFSSKVFKFVNNNGKILEKCYGFKNISDFIRGSSLKFTLYGVLKVPLPANKNTIGSFGAI